MLRLLPLTAALVILASLTFAVAVDRAVDDLDAQTVRARSLDAEMRTARTIEAILRTFEAEFDAELEARWPEGERPRPPLPG